MNRLLTIAMALSATGCGESGGASAPDRPDCERASVIKWLEAAQCPASWVWAVQWEQDAPERTCAQVLEEGEAPIGGDWVPADVHVCLQRLSTDTLCSMSDFPPYVWGPSAGWWRIDGPVFEYRYLVDSLPGHHDVICDDETDTVNLTIKADDSPAVVWSWYANFPPERL